MPGDQDLPQLPADVVAQIEAAAAPARHMDMQVTMTLVDTDYDDAQSVELNVKLMRSMLDPKGLVHAHATWAVWDEVEQKIKMVDHAVVLRGGDMAETWLQAMLEQRIIHGLLVEADLDDGEAPHEIHRARWLARLKQGGSEMVPCPG